MGGFPVERNRWLDFTSLLDVFLILLFVLLINRQISEHQLESTYAAEVEALMGQTNQLQIALKQWEEQETTDTLNRLEDQAKYHFLQERAVVIDLELKTELNRLWINDKPTSIYLVKNRERRESQKNRIKQELVQEFQGQRSEGTLLLVTLDTDEEVYRYAYLIMQEAAQEWVRERPLSESYLLQIR